MPREYSWEVRERAEELYIVEGLTFEQVAEATGVSATQLKTWSAEGDWPGRKREYRQELSGIKRNTTKLMSKLLEKALQSLNPQDVYAISSLQAVMNRSAGGEPAQAPLDPEREIKTASEAVDALEAALERQLNILLARPEKMSLGAIKDVDKALKLIGDMKKRHMAESLEAPEERRGLSDETAEQIRRLILGVQG
jgi:transposase-like protein